jgi:GNAT superfamily N-acetyltransferase
VGGLVTRSVGSADALGALLAGWWGSTTIVSRGVPHDAARLPALVAERDGEIAGVLTYNVCDGELEIVSINAVEPGGGVGTALLATATELARARDCRRVWLVTTNDNLDALRFYQRRGLRLVAVHRGAVDDARRLEPSIPEVGAYGISLHDELELERRL